MIEFVRRLARFTDPLSMKVKTSSAIPMNKINKHHLAVNN